MINPLYIVVGIPSLTTVVLGIILLVRFVDINNDVLVGPSRESLGFRKLTNVACSVDSDLLTIFTDDCRSECVKIGCSAFVTSEFIPYACHLYTGDCDEYRYVQYSPLNYTFNGGERKSYNLARTDRPTSYPTLQPTRSPTVPGFSAIPTRFPTQSPNSDPTVAPTPFPTFGISARLYASIQGTTVPSGLTAGEKFGHAICGHGGHFIASTSGGGTNVASRKVFHLNMNLATGTAPFKSPRVTQIFTRNMVNSQHWGNRCAMFGKWLAITSRMDFITRQDRVDLFELQPNGTFVETANPLTFTGAQINDADYNGFSIAMSEDTLFVGRPYWSGAGHTNIGRVHIYKLTSNVWTAVQDFGYELGSDVVAFITPGFTTGPGSEQDHFGTAVAVYGDHAVVSAMALKGRLLFFKRNSNGIWDYTHQDDGASYLNKKGSDLGASLSMYNGVVVAQRRIVEHFDDTLTTHMYRYNSGTNKWDRTSSDNTNGPVWTNAGSVVAGDNFAVVRSRNGGGTQALDIFSYSITQPKYIRTQHFRFGVAATGASQYFGQSMAYGGGYLAVADTASGSYKGHVTIYKMLSST